MDDPYTVMPVRIPAGTMVDGAIAELAQDANGVVTASIRIPGPAVP